MPLIFSILPIQIEGRRSAFSVVKVIAQIDERVDTGIDSAIIPILALLGVCRLELKAIAFHSGEFDTLPPQRCINHNLIVIQDLPLQTKKDPLFSNRSGILIEGR
jgi:hypothetical protein